MAARTIILALIAIPALAGSATIATAQADRSLKLFFTHTGERATITFKRDGKFDPSGLAKINRFLRDWRKNEPARMDPRLLDLVWEVYDRSGATDYIHIVSAYRSPTTNKMLRGRSRSTGVAKNSQHMLGKAMDFYIPGVKVATLRALAMQVQVGGVGYYPTSGSPFVHLDVGNVRAWPRMTRKELARIFPRGKTMHLPADGRPLPGYELAVADYKRRVGAKSIVVAATAGDVDDAASTSSGRSGLLTAMLPTPKNRALEAFEIQAGQQTKQIGPPPEFVDLASMAVPVPSFRPVAVAEDPQIETAALGPSSGLMTNTVFRPAAIFELQYTAASIAFLPITAADVKPADARGTLLRWALSEPGSTMSMTAPIFSSRNLRRGAGSSSNGTVPRPADVAKNFDHTRFSSL